MKRFLQPFSLALGLWSLILMLGFLFQIDFLTQLWPWQLGRFSALFMASMFAAIAAPVIWVGIKGETGVIFGGAVNLGVMLAGMGVFSLQLYLADNSRQAILYFAIVLLSSVLIIIGVGWQSWGLTFKDSRPTPPIVRYSFIVFAIALFLVGSALVFKTPNIFPWNLSEELMVLYGWVFLGDMCYFLFGVYQPKWANAQGHLMAFLAYDLVLIVPFIQHLSDVLPEQRTSLIIYIAVLVYSGLLAIYFLFFHKETRFGSLAQTV